jgi:hypothetical protein
LNSVFCEANLQLFISAFAMGVPAFFRWLSRKYPSIVVNAVEEGRTIDGENIPVDATQPNPNYQVGSFFSIHLTIFTGIRQSLFGHERHHSSVHTSGGSTSAEERRGNVHAYIRVH